MTFSFHRCVVAPKNSKKRQIVGETGFGLPAVTGPKFESMESRLLMSATIDLDDESGLHVLPMPELTAELAETAATGPLGTTVAYSLSDTFLLSSVPGANQTIYLDFTGHVTSGTIWNTNFAGGQDIVTPAYDFDGNTSSFSDAELQSIQYIWQRVAEDFIPFNVNVTTLDPGSAALIKSGTGDTAWGVRVAIGGSSYDWFGQGAGGVAYIGSFNWNTDTPTYVFDEQLGNGHEKYTAEAISHEAGHTLGLDHDGTPTEGYYTGHGSGETGWAPIMGVGYYQNLAQWSKGEYTGASQKQDDLAIITTQNGFGYRTDDHGNTTSSASALSVAGNSVSGGGIVERNTDVDLFSFATGAGAVSLNITPAVRGPNLDILAELLDSAGNVIASANPADLLSASINVNLSAGNYYLRIDGVGKGDPLGTGYSDYGSLGQYSISGSIVPAGATLSINDVSVNESAGTATFTVSLSQASTSAVTVDVATANGGAAAGSDYQSVLISGLTFDPGVTSRTVTVPIINDLFGEATETFSVNLSNAAGATILDGVGVGTVLDDDVTVSVSNASATETNPGPRSQLRTTDMIFTISLSAANSSSVTVQYATANGTAVAGTDYTAASGAVTFNPGETSKTVIIKIIGDTLVETSETLLLNLTSAAGAAIGDGQGVGSITDNDSGGGGGGKPNKGPAIEATAPLQSISSSLLASIAANFKARPAPAAIDAFLKSAKPALLNTAVPLFVFEIFQAEDGETESLITSVLAAE